MQITITFPLEPCPFGLLVPSYKLDDTIINVGGSYCYECKYHDNNLSNDSYVYCKYKKVLRGKKLGRILKCV